MQQGARERIAVGFRVHNGENYGLDEVLSHVPVKVAGKHTCGMVVGNVSRISTTNCGHGSGVTALVPVTSRRVNSENFVQLVQAREWFSIEDFMRVQVQHRGGAGVQLWRALHTVHYTYLPRLMPRQVRRGDVSCDIGSGLGSSTWLSASTTGHNSLTSRPTYLWVTAGDVWPSRRCTANRSRLTR